MKTWLIFIRKVDVVRTTQLEENLQLSEIMKVILFINILNEFQLTKNVIYLVE